jgi:glycosyltransferase involved in cell wall biosynthesis
MTSTPQPYVHVITPGDHFSPRTGSAVPTVVDGLCRSAGADASRSTVVVARDTYADRYDSAEVIEYDLPAQGRVTRYVDVVCGRVGLPRLGTRRVFAAALGGQRNWAESFIFMHNAPQAVPLVESQHRAVLYAHNFLLRTYSSREVEQTLRNVSAIVCVSAALANSMSGPLSSSLQEKIRVVRNGVDCVMFRPSHKKQRVDVVNVMFVGRMIHDKGADLLIEALRSVNRTDLSLTLVGSAGFAADGPLSAYERELRKAGAALGTRVRFLPFVARHELAELMRSADMLVVPSRWPEPFGLTVLEGMACGLPVVASAVGGIPEAMGPAGIQVPPEDAGALAEAIRSLAVDDEYRAAVGSACRAHAEAHDWTWVRRNLDEVLAKLA